MTTFSITSATEVVEAVAWAAASELPLEIIGHGSKRNIGKPLQSTHTLDLSKLTGVTLYEPEELVLSARAGTPIAEIEKLLRDNGQQFDFEPMDHGPLLGLEAGMGTLGGLLGANLAGPRRVKSGAARDHVLGVHAVSGRGEAFKSGGRVVKNVTGYDLSKGMAGSWGTLAVATDITFKVLPAAETETTLAIRDLDDDRMAAALSLAMGSSCEVSGAAHLPSGIVQCVAHGILGDRSATLIRVEGFGPSVLARIAKLKDVLNNGSQIDEIEEQTSRAIWREVRNVKPFADGTEKPVWRVSVAPSEGWKLALALRMETPAMAFFDWQGGLVWLRMEGDPQADVIRSMIAECGGGHATLVRAPLSWRGAVPVFEPQPAPLAALSQRLKREFDPKGILNPGRMG